MLRQNLEDWGNSSSSSVTSCMVMLYSKLPIMWKLKIQKTITLFMEEAKYYTTFRWLAAR